MAGGSDNNRPIQPVIHLVLERGRTDLKEGDHPISDDKCRRKRNHSQQTRVSRPIAEILCLSCRIMFLSKYIILYINGTGNK